MACLPFICSPKVKRGFMPLGVNILLASVLLFRLVSLGCAVYALVMINTDTVLQTVHTSFVDSLYVFGTIPLGYMLVVITYSCACAMMPIQVINSVLGLAGALFTSRKIVYAHICMSFFTIPALIVYLVLLSGGLHDFYYGIQDRFREEMTSGLHAADIRTKLTCCGVSGPDPCLHIYVTSKQTPGCWDLWENPVHSFLSTMLAFVISMLILEVLNLVITDYEYRKWRLKEEPERAGNTGVLPYIPRDAFGDICIHIVHYWRKGALQFIMRCLALFQGCVGVILVTYGAYNIKGYPSLVSENPLSRLRFHNIYFDDLIRILASLLVLCGSISLVTSLQGVSITCVTSRAAYYLSAFINTLGMLVTMTVIIFWGVFNSKVRYYMEREVEDLFSTALRYEPHLPYAFDLVQTMKCCGITDQQDFMNLVPAGTLNRISPYCTDFRPCVPVLQDHFRTFSGVGLGFLSFLLVSQILSFTYASKKVVELNKGSHVSESNPTSPDAQPISPAAQPTSPAVQPTSPATKTTRPVTQPTIPHTQTTRPATQPTRPATQPTSPAAQPTIPAAKPTSLAAQPTSPAAKPTSLAAQPTSPAAQPTTTAPEPESKPPVVRYGVFGIITRRVSQLWADDKANGVAIVLKFITLLCGLSLVVTGLLLRFDDVFDDVDLSEIFHTLSFNHRRFTYYLPAIAFGMLGLGVSEMILAIYGFLIYCWNSKFLEYTLIVLRGMFLAALIVLLGLSIETKSNIDWTMYDRLITEFKKYNYYNVNGLLPWKLLMFKMECCGIGNYGDFNSIIMSYTRKIPIYCCKNVIEWEPDLDSGMESCTDSLAPGSFYEQGCNEALLDRFGGYMITFFCLLSFLVIFQVFHIVLSARRIRMLKPGNAIDKEIGILTGILCKTGPLPFGMRCLALCQCCVGVALVVYGDYNLEDYPSFVSENGLSRLRFHNIYFDDLIRILASLLVLCGSISLFASLQGFSVTCVTSRAAYYVSALINMLAMMLTVAVIIFWGVFNTKVRYGMKQEVEDLFSSALRYSPTQGYAIDLVQTMKCCGITDQQDFMNLVPAGSWNPISSYCTDFRPCVPVLQDHFRTFSGVGLGLLSFLFVLQILSFTYANKKIVELNKRSPVSESEPSNSATEPEPSNSATEPESTNSATEPESTTPVVRYGVFGILKRRVSQLWADDRASIVGILLKFVSLFFGLALFVTGLLFKFDDVLEDSDLYNIYHLLAFNNRRFTFYLVAIPYGMMGLAVSEMTITFYGLAVYCWDSKFLEYILIVLQVTFLAVLIVLLGLSIETKSNIDWTMYDQLITEFKKYHYYYTFTGLPWKLLIFKLKCCGIGNYGDFNSILMSYTRKIPIYCCKNVIEWEPDLYAGMESCTNSLAPGSFYEQGCNEALLDRFGGFMITFFCLLSFLVILQVFHIVLSARRIRMLKPGNAIDKEIGILLNSITGKYGKNKITDSGEEKIHVVPKYLLQIGGDIQRNTILPSLNTDALRHQQAPPNTTTLIPEIVPTAEQPPPNTTPLIPETVATTESSRRTRRKKGMKKLLDKEDRKHEPAEQGEIRDSVTMQDNGSLNVEQNENDKEAAGKRRTRTQSARPFANLGRKGRSSEKQESDNNGENYKNDRLHENKDLLPTTAQSATNDVHGSVSAAPNSHKTTVEIVNFSETEPRGETPIGEKARETETRKQEQEVDLLLNTNESKLDHGDLKHNKESDKSNTRQRESLVHVEEKSPNVVPSSEAETSVGIQREGVILVRNDGKETENKVDTSVSGGYIEVGDSRPVDGSPEKVVVSEGILDQGESDQQATEREVVSAHSDRLGQGQSDPPATEREVVSKTSDRFAHDDSDLPATKGDVVSEQSDRLAQREPDPPATEREIVFETSDRLAQGETDSTATERQDNLVQEESEPSESVSKMRDTTAEDVKLNNSDDNDNDLPYVYEDDFSDVEEDNDTGAIDFFKQIAGN